MSSTASPPLPADVQQVCAEHGLLLHLQTAMRLAEAHFAPVRSLSVEADEDPDTGERGVVVDVAVDMTADEAFERYKAYGRAWVGAVPPDARCRIALCYRRADEASDVIAHRD